MTQPPGLSPSNEPTLPPDPSRGDGVALPPSGGTPRPSLPSLAEAGYDVLGELGRGGMGVVYQARDVRLNRLVALKMVLAGSHAGEQELARFRTEAQAVARLQHPNIVQIYDVGEHDGHAFLALEFVSGGSLSARLDGTPWLGRPAADLVKTLAEAIHYAHQRGVIHRDLKPANILLHIANCELPTAKQGNICASQFATPNMQSAIPKVTDFGLAKQLDAGTRHTRTGAVMGTPSYMAPEQAAGQSKRIGPATDVYALGAILYELLTGRPPFRAETTFDTLMQVLEREPAPVRLLNPKVDRDLETVCCKCLEKDPQRRYPNAQALADDLARYLRGDSISVRSVNVLDRLARSLERSQLGADFHSWGTMLLGWAAVVLVTHLGLFLVVGPTRSKLLSVGTYLGQFAAMTVVYAALGPKRLRPSGAAETQLWSVWTGYVIACFLLFPVSQQLLGDDPADYFATFPYACLLTGLAFFVLGGSHWGRYYAFGLAFFVLAALLPFWLDLAPLLFGLLWSAALVLTGRQLCRLGAESQVPSPTPSDSDAPTVSAPGPG